MYPKVLPYLYHPGRSKGTEQHPLPSRYPTMYQVAEICAEVFQEYGRGSTKWNNRKRNTTDLPRITADLLLSKAYRQWAIIADCRAICMYIIYHHARWIKSARLEPQPYSKVAIGKFMDVRRGRSSQLIPKAEWRIGRDEHFTTMYFTCLSALKERYDVNISPLLEYVRRK